MAGKTHTLEVDKGVTHVRIIGLFDGKGKPIQKDNEDGHSGKDAPTSGPCGVDSKT